MIQCQSLGMTVKSVGSTSHIHAEEVMEQMVTHMNSTVAFVLTFDLC